MTILLSGILTACGTQKAPTTGVEEPAVETSVETTEPEQKESEEKKESTEKTPEVTPEPVEEETTPDYEEIYQDVLDAMHRIIAHPESAEQTDEDEESFAVLEAASYHENPLRDIGYAFMDLSGDGVSELVIGNVNNNSYPGNTLLAVYTVKDGEVVYSFGGPSRNPHFLMGDGRILYYISYGYTSYGFGLSTLNAEGTTLTCEELLYTGIGPDGETPAVFENKEGLWDEDSAYLSDMTMEDYEKAWDGYVADTQFVELTPFAQYTHPDGYAGVEGILPVYVSYADESLLSDCESYVLDDETYSEWLSIYANMSVNHFYVLKLSDLEYFEDGTFNYSTEEVVEYDTLEQGMEIAVKMNLPETVPFYAISYFEENGTFHSYAVIVSGEDGSIKLMNLNN